MVQHTWSNTHRQDSLVPGLSRDNAPTPWHPTARLLVPLCMQAFCVAVPPLWTAHPLKQMCCTSACCV